MKVKYISLVNLIMDRLVVKELIQDEMTAPKLTAALKEILQDERQRRELANSYRQLREMLMSGGNASGQAAASICHFLQQ